MLSTRSLTWALRVTAVVNLVAATAAIVAPGTNVALLYGLEPLDAMTLRFHWMAWLAVGVMGVGYAVASRDPASQSGILVAGALGKLGFALILVEMLFSSLGTTLLLVIIAFDGFLGVWFAAYLLSRLGGRD